jgi:hypothetical protein
MRQIVVDKFLDKPFYNASAEKAADQICDFMSEAVEAYNKQYGFLITGIEVVFQNHGAIRSYITMKK